jgi:uncharacterized YigZ family protein
MAHYLTLARPIHLAVPPIKKSRFFGDGAPVVSAAEAMVFVDGVRKKFPDAGHHCFAWRLKSGDAGFRTHDDGEPGGTGGPPILNHIDGAGLVGVVFVVTRYFGGTKLGKGGLIRAYGGTAGAAIKAAEIISIQETTTLKVRTSYADQGTIEGVLRGFGLTIHNPSYDTQVCFDVAVPVEDAAQLQGMLVEVTSGRVCFA